MQWHTLDESDEMHRKMQGRGSNNASNSSSSETPVISLKLQGAIVAVGTSPGSTSFSCLSR
jgi:hypothetical protein